MFHQQFNVPITQVLDLLALYWEDSLEPLKALLEALYLHPPPASSERITVTVKVPTQHLAQKTNQFP